MHSQHPKPPKLPKRPDRPEQYLVDLFKDVEYRIRKRHCLGCLYNHPSSSKHSVCLTNQYIDVYRPQVIRCLLLAHDLSWSEFKTLQRVLNFETPIY